MTTTAVGSPQQAAEKIARDLGVLADKLDRLRERPDWDHDDVIAPAVKALTGAARGTVADRDRRRARARARADDERQADLGKARAARHLQRTAATDRKAKASKGR